MGLWGWLRLLLCPGTPLQCVGGCPGPEMHCPHILGTSAAGNGCRARSSLLERGPARLGLRAAEYACSLISGHGDARWAWASFPLPTANMTRSVGNHEKGHCKLGIR